MSPEAQNPIDEIRRLISANAHLSLSALSAYINFSDDLATTEVKWIESHLSNCPSCQTLFENVFDDELEFDRSTRESDCMISTDPSGLVTIADRDGLIRATVTRSTISFPTLPAGIHRLQLSVDTSVRLRLTHAECNVPYPFHTTVDSGNTPPNMKIRYTVLRYAKIERFPLILRYAAAAILILGTTLAVWLATQDQEPLPVAENPQVIDTDSVGAGNQRDSTEPEEPSIRTTVPARQFAYVENPNLELFVNRHYRTATVEFTQPASGVELGSMVTFKWSTDDSVRIAITVVDNVNREIWRAESAESELPAPIRLKPGLYYWFARIDDEIAHVGKFRIATVPSK